jgi:VIT1/CCC1 family predicted Fe2+/Mn2+ transporter
MKNKKGSLSLVVVIIFIMFLIIVIGRIIGWW